MQTINATKMMHEDVKMNHGVNNMMTSRNSTDCLESEIGVIRGTLKYLIKEHVCSEQIQDIVDMLFY